MTILHKITPGMSDEVCRQCNQCYEDTCVAFQVPHSDQERGVREQGNFGMECDSLHLKELRWRRYGLLYRTPAGQFDKPFQKIPLARLPNRYIPDPRD